MNETEQTCKKCGLTMLEVTNLAPVGSQAGLRAFICDSCGATDSFLVFAQGATRGWDSDRGVGPFSKRRR